MITENGRNLFHFRKKDYIISSMACRAELKREEPEEKRILYGERELLLQKNQVLSIDKVYEIACKYLDQELQEDYFWRELDL